MKGCNSWSYHPYKPLLRDMGDIHICRIAPTEHTIHIEWLSSADCTYEVYFSLRDKNAYSLYMTTDDTKCDITGLQKDMEYAFYVQTGKRKSAVRFARTGEIVGTVVNYLHHEDPYYSFSGNFLASPSLIMHPEGYLLSSMDVFGKSTPQNLTTLFRSDDGGKTWNYLNDLFPCFWGKLFLHKDALYMLACTTEYGDLVIGKSLDGGKTFCSPVTLLRGSNGKAGNVGVHKNPQPLVRFRGRLWGTLEWGSWGAGYHAAMVMSCDENADLLNPENWNFSEPVKYDRGWPGVAKGESTGNIEGTLAISPDGKLYNIMRYDTTKTEPQYGIVLAYEVNTDDPEAPLKYAHPISLPGNLAKFTIKYDPVSKKYYTLLSRIAGIRAFTQRRILSLMRSENLLDWELVKDIYNYYGRMDHPVAGFQYADYEFDGEDIIFLCRVGLNDAPSGHDSNYQVFDRIEDFRKL